MAAAGGETGSDVRRRPWFVVASIISVLVVATLATGALGDSVGGLYRLSGLVGQIFTMVRASYVEEVPVERLEGGAMTGLVSAADPGGAFVPEEQFGAFSGMKRRALPAYGLVLGMRSSYPVVLQVLPASPAEAAGLVRGELLERVDGKMVRAMPLWQVELILDQAERRGGGAAVEVIDRRLRGRRAVVLPRGTVKAGAPVVEEHDGVRVLRPVVLDGETARSVEQMLAGKAGAAGIVVDLRGVALGDRQGSADLAAVIAGGEIEIPLLRKGGDAGTVRARGKRRGWKVVACVDVTTAGAGEVLAVALKRSGATLVGSESYGDTGERRAHRVRGGTLWLAETWCKAPDGTGVIGRGLVPDELVRAREGEDPILKRALEIARGDAARTAG